MAFSIYSVVILLLLESFSDAAENCDKKFLRFEGGKINGAGVSLEVSGFGVDSVEASNEAATKCEDLCRRYPKAKAWGLEHFKKKICTCFENVESSADTSAYHSAKFCNCHLKHHPGVSSSSRFALPAFCQTKEGKDVPAAGELPHGTTCNLTCAGNYVGTPGVAECRARDWTNVGSRVVLQPGPQCHLDSTTVLYASIAGGVGAVVFLFVIVIGCLNLIQKRKKRRENENQVTMRKARAGAGGVGDEEDIGADRRKSYKKATGHLSIDEDSREVDLMINGQQEGIVYANVDRTNNHPQRHGQNVAEPTTMIGVPDVGIYLEGNIASGNEERNEYIHVNDNRS